MLGKENIRVNAVTPFTFIKDESREFYETQRDLLSMYETIVSLGHLGEADEIADCILFFVLPTSGMTVVKICTLTENCRLFGESRWPNRYCGFEADQVRLFEAFS